MVGNSSIRIAIAFASWASLTLTTVVFADDAASRPSPLSIEGKTGEQPLWRAGGSQGRSESSAQPNQPVPGQEAVQEPSQKKVTLRTLLRSDDPRKRAAGIHFVVKNKVIKAGPRLEEIAKTDSSAQIRGLACHAMGALNLKEAMLTLRTVARNDPSHGVRHAAQEALKKIHGSEPKKDTILRQQPDEKSPPAPKKKPRGICKVNRDCKGKQLCQEGRCEDPPRRATTGWALEASIIGFIGSATTLGLNIYSALEPQDLLPAIPLAASATLVTIIVAPSVSSGSRSVRNKSDVPGSLTLRVIGWMCFGLHIGGSLGLAAAIPFHWIKKNSEGENWTPKTSWIMANGVVGAFSLLTLSVEALVARRQAKRLIARQKKPIEPGIDGHITPPVNTNKPQAPSGVQKITPPMKSPRTTLRVVPFISPIVSRDGSAGAALGIVGLF